MEENKYLIENEMGDPNVTLEDPAEEQDYFPCPVCKRMLKVEYSKSDKPYVICNECGVQLFIRGKEGIKRLKKLIGNNKKDLNSREIINSLDYLDELNNKLNEIEDKKPFFSTDKDLDL